MNKEQRKRNIEAVDAQIAELTRAPGPTDSMAVVLGRAGLAAELYARNEQTTTCYMCEQTTSRIPVNGPLVCDDCKKKAKKAVLLLKQQNAGEQL